VHRPLTSETAPALDHKACAAWVDGWAISRTPPHSLQAPQCLWQFGLHLSSLLRLLRASFLRKGLLLAWEKAGDAGKDVGETALLINLLQIM
jgi:hypothetical protein